MTKNNYNYSPILDLDPTNADQRRRRCLVNLFIFGLAVIGLGGLFIHNSQNIDSTSTTGSSALANAQDTDDNHFAIVVDAGSSGSRAYLYSWPAHSGNPNDLLKISPLLDTSGEPLVKSVSPGLSSFGGHPDDAFDYIRPLMEYAAQHIPESHHTTTPLFILATAGMRLIDHDQQELIMANVRQGISAQFNFHFPDGNLEIISGKQEGIYQWLAINYVLDKFEQGGHGRPQTVGAIDMGGASMQIAMEVTPDLSLDGFSESDKAKVVEVNLGCREKDSAHRYRIFVTTFLGFGANEAMSRYLRHALLSQVQTSPNSELRGLSADDYLPDPCLPNGLKENWTLHLDLDRMKNQEGVNVLKSEMQLFLIGTGQWDLCYQTLSEFTASAEPYYQSCSTDDQGCPDPGIKMPPIPLEKSEFYGFSEFWYTMEDVVKMGGPYSYDKFSAASKAYCASNWIDTYQRYLNGAYPTADLERLKTQCIKSSWVPVALHEGFKFPKSYSKLSSAPNTVNGQVVHWTVGALLYRTRFFPLSSSRRLSAITEMIKCPRLSYLYPFPSKSPRFHSSSNVKDFFSSMFVSFNKSDDEQKRKKSRRKAYLPFYMTTQLTLSPHASIIGKIIDVDHLVSQINLGHRGKRRDVLSQRRPAIYGVGISVLALYSIVFASSGVSGYFRLPQTL